jgi:glycosyltransferase involved in cell wall biosynthesis
MPPKVLFLSHDAQPHGAQISLLHLVRWLAANTRIRPRILLKRDGPLRQEFAAVGETTVLGPGDSAGLLRHGVRDAVDLVYSNTITNGEVLAGLAGVGCPVISHVHELGYWITYRSGALNNALVLEHTDYFIAASQAVADCLIKTLQVPAERIFVIHECIPTHLEAWNSAMARQSIKAELSIPAESLIVGGSGTTDWRKSPDLFVQLAHAVRSGLPKREVHFVWVGGDNTGPEYGMLWHDVRRLGLESRVHFVGHQENVRDYFAVFDLFALTSREDPYPLVALEAAALGVPILAFEQGGGIPEFIENDCGFVVPYLNVSAMAERAVQLIERSELRRQLGECARRKVQARHDVKVAGPRIANLIDWAILNHRLRKTPQRHAA